MPSNAMKISQLVTKLQTIAGEQGDLDCVLVLTGDREVYAVDGKNVNVGASVGNRQLPAPVLMFGLVLADNGQPTTGAGAAYQVTASDDPWTYNRFDAPEGVDLDVWRRSGVVKDIGQRQGERWFVYNGGETLIEIVADAILAWKARS